MRRPFERGIGIGQIGGAERQCRHIEPVGPSQRLAEPCAVEAVIGVGGVLRGRQSSQREHFAEVRPPPAQQRAEQRHPGARHHSPRPHSGKARHAAASVQSGQQSFGLIVGMVRGGERLQPFTLHPSGQRSVASSAGLGLHIARFNRYTQRCVRNLKFTTDLADKGRFRRAFGAQAVIDCRSGNPSGEHRMGQQQQRQTIRPARNGQPQPPLTGPQRGQIGREAGGQGWRTIHLKPGTSARPWSPRIAP